MIKQFIVTLAFSVLLSQICFSQEQGQQEKEDTVAFNIVETQPEFVGGNKALGAYIRKNFNYPTQAKKTSISGKVFVQFIVKKDGSITEIKVAKGVHDDLRS